MRYMKIFIIALFLISIPCFGYCDNSGEGCGSGYHYNPDAGCWTTTVGGKTITYYYNPCGDSLQEVTANQWLNILGLSDSSESAFGLKFTIETFTNYAIAAPLNTQDSVNSYIELLKNNPQSPDLLADNPGYFNFRGILASGKDISISGYSRILGGVYAGGNLSLGQCSMITEDAAYIYALKLQYGEPLNSLFAGTNPIINLPAIKSRVNVIQFVDIDANEFNSF